MAPRKPDLWQHPQKKFQEHSSYLKNDATQEKNNHHFTKKYEFLYPFSTIIAILWYSSWLVL